MEEISDFGYCSPSRPAMLDSSQSSPCDNSPKDHDSGARSYTILHDTDSGSAQNPATQLMTHFRAYGFDQTHESLEFSTGRTSPTCVPSPNSSGLLGTAKPQDGPSPFSRRLSAQQRDLFQIYADTRYTSLIRNWKWEILSMVTSLGLLIGMIVTLGKYNHSQHPEWPYNININSLASVLTAVIIAQLGFVLAELISQLKWSWFRQPHPLEDLEHYDAASRGVVGSLTFLARFVKQPRAYFAVGAAFVLVTSAAIGPFTQQSIKSYACQRPLHNITASIPTASWINSSLIVEDTGMYGQNLKMHVMTAAWEGLVLGSANDNRQVPFNCPTGNCDFGSYSSLAYCSSCVETTSSVQESLGPNHLRPDASSEYWNYTIPQRPEVYNSCQLSFKDSKGHPVLESASGNLTHFVICTAQEYDPKYRSATKFNILSISWANCSYDHEDGGSDDPGCSTHPEQLPSLANTSGLVAMNCTIWPCVKDYTARVRNGVLEERATNIASDFTERLVDEHAIFRMLKLPCILDGNKYDGSNISQVPRTLGRHFTTVNIKGGDVKVPLECVYETDEEVPEAIDQFLGSQLLGQNQVDGLKRGACGFNAIGKASWCEPWYLQPLFHDGRLTAETISTDMDGIASSISNRMRVVGSNAYRNGSGFASGTVIQTTVCVKVDWPWLILPAALVLLTCSLLIWVIIAARSSQIADDQPVWKSSAIVAFFHGIDAQSRMPDSANEHTARPVGSLEEPENCPSSRPAPRPGIDGGLMSLKEMQARSKTVVVKLETAVPGRRGFILVNEEQDEHRLASKKQHGPQRLANSHLDGETLPLSEPPRRRTVSGQDPTFLQVDLGTGFAPSVRGSLNQSTET